MKKISTLLLAAAFCALAFGSLHAADDYKISQDAALVPGVPQGEVIKLRWKSRIFPGTERDYWIYVPKQYEASKPACLMVFQDGGTYVSPTGQFRVPLVFDNLIHRREMPVTLGVFVAPGEVPAAQPGEKGRSNRSFEYDSLGDLYSRFLLEELLPEVDKKYAITKDPKGRAICGISSGAIAAFTVAWERPDQFSRVLSHIGSFTNIRGGNNYPSLIRKTEKKPIKVFLQDGTNDLDNLHGHWPLANQEMAAALKFMGYEHQLVMGDGGHNGKHGGSILPESLKWLWSDYKK